MRPGEKILRLLDSHSTSQSEVGRRCRPVVTPTTVGKWIKEFNETGTLAKDKWIKFAYGLRAVGIDPTVIAPVPTEEMRSVVQPELLPLLDLFASREQLQALDRILAAQEAHHFLRLIIAERLRR